jgi:hypothetical protein
MQQARCLPLERQQAHQQHVHSILCLYFKMAGTEAGVRTKHTEHFKHNMILPAQPPTHYLSQALEHNTSSAVVGSSVCMPLKGNCLAVQLWRSRMEIQESVCALPTPLLRVKAPNNNTARTLQKAQQPEPQQTKAATARVWHTLKEAGTRYMLQA